MTSTEKGLCLLIIAILLAILTPGNTSHPQAWEEPVRRRSEWGAMILATIGFGLIGTDLFRKWRMHKRIASGLCPQCGYDLRASTSRCPECGREIEHHKE